MTVVTLRRDKGSPLTHDEVDDNFAALGASVLGETLIADRTYYVANDGDDSNDGLTALEPFETIEKAFEVVAQLDLTNRYRVTVQLANGTYTPTGTYGTQPEYAFRPIDPINARPFKAYYVYIEDPFQFEFEERLDLCTLRGDPDNPANVNINGQISVFNSQAWRVVGVRISNPGPFYALISVNYFSYFAMEAVVFHFTAHSQRAVSAYWHSSVIVGDPDGATACQLTSSGAALDVDGMPASIDFGFYAESWAFIWVMEGFDCNHTAIVLESEPGDNDGYWLCAVEDSSIFDINDYVSFANSENITGGLKAIILKHSLLWCRNLDELIGGTSNGVMTGVRIDARSAINSKNEGFWTEGADLPHVIPAGLDLAPPLNAAGANQNYYTGGTIVNTGAVAMAQYVLPGEGEFYYSMVKGPDHPWGFKFTFIVTNSFGIRITSGNGWTINVAGTVGGKVESTVIGSSITLINTGEFEWTATAVLGTWVVTEQLTNSIAPTLDVTSAVMSDDVTASTGTWSSTPTRVFYQWYVNGEPISTNLDTGHTNPATVTAYWIDHGDVLTCQISVYDADGTGSVRVMTSNSCTIV